MATNKKRLKTKAALVDIKIQPHIITNNISRKFKHLGKKNVSQTKEICKLNVSIREIQMQE